MDMRIVIDLNKCQRYAQCVPLAPTVLKLNGEEALMYDPNPDDSLRLQVYLCSSSIMNACSETSEQAKSAIETTPTTFHP